MKFDCYGKGKIFLSTDSKTIKTNPFYDIFKAKSFTEKDIILRFLILDYLADGKEHTFIEIFKEINKEGTTVIVVTHDANVASFCQRTIRLHDGNIIGEETNVTA